MKKIWKALGVAVLAAAVPIRVRKNGETGKKSYQSLLLEVETIPKGEHKKEININLLDGVLTAPLSRLVTGKKEQAFFADDDPEAAAVPGIIDFAQAAAEARTAAENARDAADEAQDADDEAKDAADEAQAIADGLEAAADVLDDVEGVKEEDAGPSDFEPENF